MKTKATNPFSVAAGSGGSVLLAAIAFAAPGPETKPFVPPPAALVHGPIATYDAACARCHGPKGSFYGPDLGKGKTDTQLRQVIREMAEGPSQLPTLPSVELDAQTAYHRALIKGEPFLAVTFRGETRLEGEVTSGATVTVATGGKTAAAKVEGSHWSIPLTAKAPAPIVTARRGKAISTLDTAKAAFSHAEPLTKSTSGQATK